MLAVILMKTTRRWSKRKCLSTPILLLELISVNGEDQDAVEDFRNQQDTAIGRERGVALISNVLEDDEKGEKRRELRCVSDENCMDKSGLACWKSFVTLRRRLDCEKRKMCVVL